MNMRTEFLRLYLFVTIYWAIIASNTNPTSAVSQYDAFNLDKRYLLEFRNISRHDYNMNLSSSELKEYAQVTYGKGWNMLTI
jgi:hypothetical protein